MTHRSAWKWRALAEARPPRAAVALGQAACARLLARVAAADPACRRTWAVTASSAALVVVGDTPTLPWADGTRYAAPHPEAAGLWLPTNEEPELPADLLWQALARSTGRAPLLLWKDPALVLPLDRQQGAADEVLRTIALRWRQGAA